MRDTEKCGVRSAECGIAALWRFAGALGVLGLLAAGSNAIETGVGATETPAHAQVGEQLSETLTLCRELQERIAPYAAVFRRNPMVPLIDEQGRLISSVGLHGGLAVQGIIWSPEHPMAVIDDELFSQGDAVGPYTILTIEPDGVLVQRGERTQVIPLDRGLSTQPMVSLLDDTPSPNLPARHSVSVDSIEWSP